MALYLCTSNAMDSAVRICQGDTDGALVLLQDAVTAAHEVPPFVSCYALTDDVERRGLVAHMPAHVQYLSYADLVALMVSTSVVNVG